MPNARLHLVYLGAALLVLNSANSTLADPNTWREQGPGPTLFESNTVVLELTRRSHVIDATSRANA